jgi:hypothetical protein
MLAQARAEEGWRHFVVLLVGFVGRDGDGLCAKPRGIVGHGDVGLAMLATIFELQAISHQAANPDADQKVGQIATLGKCNR